MQVVKYPTQKQLSSLLKRPSANTTAIEERVATILQEVKNNGDAALKNYAQTLDKVTLKTLRVTDKEIKDAIQLTDKTLQKAIKAAYKNIYKFHAAQKQPVQKIESTNGVVCWRQSVAIQNVGLYIPGGSAPLFSTVLMLGIPAKIAGCSNIILCTPPGANGQINPAILFAAGLCGITQIYKAGGAQAIAAMAYGTKTIPRVHKIFGPGNQYVTLAKQLIQKNGVAIDMPAGPSEVMVVGDQPIRPRTFNFSS
jgi:histidinol dehydrogenase